MSRGLALVTGGAGFVGSHVVDDLLESGWAVRVLDSLSPSVHPSRPAYLRADADYRTADVRDPDAVRAALEGVDAVSHQAAKVGLGVDLSDIDDYVAHNSLGTAVLLRELGRRGFEGRLVLASSMVVYGEGAYECTEHGPVAPAPRALSALEDGRFDPACPECGRELAHRTVEESAPTDPRNVYAATKLNQEHLAQAWARETGCEVTSLRYHNVYGPRMPRDTPYSGVAAIFRSQVEAGGAPQVFEDGKQIRDFVHVRDVARANRLALEAPEGVSGPFNIASGAPRPILDMAEALAGLAGGPGAEVTGQFRKGDVRHVYASIAHARRDLGFAPAVDFEAGVREFSKAELRDPVQ